MDKILNIEEYDQIVLYRHVNPDLDAFGSQLGMYWTLKSIFPQKNIVLYGNMDSDLMHLYPNFEIGEIINGRTLGIVLDTANRERIDGDTSLCDKVLKIDHHIVVDTYGDINIEVESASSCSEIVTLLFKEACIEIPIEAANALYLGIIGDSNRFMYSSTSSKTFEAASYLLDAGINIEQLYQKLYMRKKSDLEVTKFIYNHYQEDSGVAWYYLSTEDLIQLDISREQGSNYVNTLANIEEFQVWLAVTQNDIDHNYRVSIRSRGIVVNEIANEFHGGGHMYASGATLSSLDELEVLVGKLKEKING
ncbi:bifunctional oligoribonuclease/PAP phosphatase NrnA [Coprobacillus cateniformis]|nr:bifunctional oligoribonuclease/PAP phosphatase NrnA [Coprobacillus cateniformis]